MMWDTFLFGDGSGGMLMKSVTTAAALTVFTVKHKLDPKSMHPKEAPKYRRFSGSTLHSIKDILTGTYYMLI